MNGTFEKEDDMDPSELCFANVIDKDENGTTWSCFKCDEVGQGWKKRPCLRPAKPDLITERETTHGDFTVNSHVSQAIKRAVRAHAGYMNLHDYQKEALDAIAGKIGRIIAGNADFRDHWIDIEGYARLVVQRLENKA